MAIIRHGMAILLLSGAALATVVHAQARHVITPTDIATLKQVTDAQIAPEGQQVIYNVRTSGDPAKLGPTHLWVVATGTGAHPRQLPGSEEGDSTPRWSPDGRAVAFLAMRHAGAPKQGMAPLSTQLWLASPWDAPARPLGPLPGSVNGFRWSPDGRQIAVLVNAEPSVPASGNGVIDVGRHPSVAQVYLIDVAGGSVRVVTSPDMFAFDVDWSPDGKRLIVRYGTGPGLDYFWYQSRVAVLDLQGQQLALLPHRATALHPSFSPDGRRVVYGYFNTNGITGVVAIYDFATGQSTLIGKDWNGSLRDLQWSSDGRSLTGLGFENLSPVFVDVDAVGGKVIPRFPIKGDPYEFSRASNGTLAFVASTRQQPEEVWLSSGKKTRVLTDTNPQVRDWQLGKLEMVQWKSRRDGTTLQGLLMLPADAHAGQPLKTLVQIHGGPYDAWSDGWLGSWHSWAQMLAMHGYAVFMPNPRGSDGRGDAFATANVGDWGGSDFQDVLDGVAALEAQRIIDPDYVAIGGWSYGGYLSAWAAGHDGPFKTAIVGAGMTDLTSMALTTDVGYSFIPPYFGDPVRERVRYAAHSPLTYVHDVRMPVLIMHGERDLRVPVFQGEMFYNALKQQGTSVEMIRYPGAPHWFGGAVGPAYEEDVQQRVLDWLNRYLEPHHDAVEPPKIPVIPSKGRIPLDTRVPR